MTVEEHYKRAAELEEQRIQRAIDAGPRYLVRAGSSFSVMDRDNDYLKKALAYSKKDISDIGTEYMSLSRSSHKSISIRLIGPKDVDHITRLRKLCYETDKELRYYLLNARIL